MVQPSRKPAFSDAEIFGVINEFVTVLAQELEVSEHRIFGAIRRKVPCGKRGRPPNQKPRLIDLESERDRVITKMVREGAIYRTIGTTLGISRARVGQIIARCMRDHGEEAVFGTVNPDLVPLDAVVRELKIARPTLRERCRANNIVIRRRRYGQYFVSVADVAALRKPNTKSCVVCGTTFEVSKNNKNAITCSNEVTDCSKERHRVLRKKLVMGEGGPLRQWHTDLTERLRGHAIPPDESWLTLREAITRSGLTRMQVMWLGYRRLVTTKPDPIRRWRVRSDQPITLYAASELDITKEVYEKWKKDGSPPEFIPH